MQTGDMYTQINGDGSMSVLAYDGSCWHELASTRDTPGTIDQDAARRLSVADLLAILNEKIDERGDAC
jgi:hypothetical protein